MPNNASGNIRNKILIRQHYLARLENGTIRQLIEPYQTARMEILQRLSALEQSGTGFTREWRIARLNAQLAETEQILAAAASQASSTIEGIMLGLASDESEFQTGLLNSQLAIIGINIINIPYKHLDYILANPLLGEAVGSKLLWTNREAVRKMKQALVQSVISGEDMAKATRRLTNAAGTGEVDYLIRERANMVARSELQYVSNMVARSIYRENQDVMKGVMFTSTLDNRTCLHKRTSVKTDQGNKCIENIKIGDLVLTHTGKYRKVKSVMTKKVKKYLKVKLSTGKTIRMTSDHKVLIDDNQWVEIGTLVAGDSICSKKEQRKISAMENYAENNGWGFNVWTERELGLSNRTKQ